MKLDELRRENEVLRLDIERKESVMAHLKSDLGRQIASHEKKNETIRRLRTRPLARQLAKAWKELGAARSTIEALQEELRWLRAKVDAA